MTTRAAVVISCLALVGCGSTSEITPGRVELTVAAASSLSESFESLGASFTAHHRDVGVKFNFGASSALTHQLNQGAPADVVATADEASILAIDALAATPNASSYFALNRLELLVQRGNPRGLTSVGDLADPSLTVVLCDPSVPCGAYAQQVLANAAATVTPKSYAPTAKAAVSSVLLGEADAAIVYATDVQAVHDRAQGLEIPAEINVVAHYPIAVMPSSDHPDAAQRFVEFVESGEGQEILRSFGFGTP